MRVLHLTQSEAELLTQIFGDVASLDLDEKYEDDLIEEITTTSGWCIKNIDYEVQLK